MILVELYSKDDCSLCHEAKAVLEKVRQEIPFTLREIKLTPGDAYWEEYKEMFPVLHIDKVKAFKYRINERLFKIKLQQLMTEKARAKNPADEPDDGGIVA